MKPRDYCCCAIPLVNAGVYAAIIEQFVLGILAGTLSVATPSIVGAATPSFAPWLFAIICYVAAGVQVLGFFGVSRESPNLFKRYVQLHLTALLVAFSVAIAWIIISATRHSTAQSNCLKNFFDNDTTNSEGTTLCNIFPWVDVGIMGGLWVVLAILQIYLYVVIASYGAMQRDDHQRYDATIPLTSDLPPDDRSDPWNARPSTDSLAGGNHNHLGHNRNTSTASAATLMQDKVEQPFDSYSASRYTTGNTYPPNNGYGSPPKQPLEAYTQEPLPTPEYSSTGNRVTSPDTMNRPERTLAHPGQSSV
ncbi:hypothetical protein PUNSTDRAFT_49034 [Punctularia strigosozonata HHB-11173 SS5]|uniref:uncharacterized protein n=1 Tax=Punctularia strigosozonata (strain HHB-11173) TaxID=741275 RepID=UPI00044182A7|nr:uncharacterized protein PUNSTDRAFT_49034 [Punctularia strigosozonata HHB-11173 SS5]EIN14212.1 hypothetical protein PUNSTDRAFT_49034 [Punctularia strigosozonata HHB-11173 SS5]